MPDGHWHDIEQPGLDANKSWTTRLPNVLIVWGLIVCALLYGTLAGANKWFPYAAVDAASNAAWVVKHKLDFNRIREIGAETDFAPDDGMRHRIAIDVPVADRDYMMLTGGEGQYLEWCPGHGCAAVVLRRDGSLVHAYPHRPDELASKRTVQQPYQELLHDDAKDTAVFGLSLLPGGDLIVVYDFQGTVPQGGGIARIDKAGHVRWYRRDYSDHWPSVTTNGEILAISHAIEADDITIPIKGRQNFSLRCASGVLGDVIRVLDLDGHVKEEIPIFDALLRSNFRTYLLPTTDAIQADKNDCDPLHSNYVRPLGPELAARIGGVRPDDLLVSLHNISAIVVVGRADHEIKRLYRGTFVAQHSAQPMPGGKILMFDNLGATGENGATRVLEFDPTTGGERTVFPTSATPKNVAFFSRVKGNIDISRDGTRALVAATEIGRGYEIRLADGEILTRFDNLQDVRPMPAYAAERRAVRFTQHGIYYVPPETLQ
jgi:hypothetical protein